LGATGGHSDWKLRDGEKKRKTSARESEENSKKGPASAEIDAEQKSTRRVPTIRRRGRKNVNERERGQKFRPKKSKSQTVGDLKTGGSASGSGGGSHATGV